MTWAPTVEILVPKVAFGQSNDALSGVEDMLLLAFLLGAVPDRERGILVEVFGLGGDAPCLHTELARQIGVSPARINQIVSKAIKRMQRRACIAGLMQKQCIVAPWWEAAQSAATQPPQANAA